MDRFTCGGTKAGGSLRRAWGRARGPMFRFLGIVVERRMPQRHT